ncbi:MAG: hypothetical protein OXG56_06945 [Gammaproteobacteria bacterium]|nr:hypothetical protein [Gammaproteobacteria bacterium]
MKSMRFWLIVFSVVFVSAGSSLPVAADGPGSGAASDGGPFFPGFRIPDWAKFFFAQDDPAENGTGSEEENGPALGTTLELTRDLDEPESPNLSQGFKIKRLSTVWQTETGALTVGSDWANFQDVLGPDKEVSSLANQKKVTSQVKWLSPNGFSISLEDSPRGEIYSDEYSLNDELGASPSLVLSWQGGPGGGAGQYRVTTMGTKLDANAAGQVFDGDSMVGWGLNLEGGWQIGDLFTALSVTYGKGINSYILQRYGNDILVQPNYQDPESSALRIRSSLYYRLNERSNFHVALGRFSSEEQSVADGVETLDTVHMGYNWHPWPRTKLEVEFIGRNVDVQDGTSEESAELKIGAEQRF